MPDRRAPARDCAHADAIIKAFEDQGYQPLRLEAGAAMA
jgi:hypothetical protein